MTAHSYYHDQFIRRPVWADLIIGPVAGALRAMAQTIENGVSRTVAAVAIIVIAGAICAVSWMAVSSYVAVTALQTTATDTRQEMKDGFANVNRRLDDLQRDRGNNGGRSGP